MGGAYTITMLSQAQFNTPTAQQSSMTRAGASPIQTKYDGPAPIKTPSNQGVMQPGSGVALPKPGFF